MKLHKELYSNAYFEFSNMPTPSFHRSIGETIQREPHPAEFRCPPVQYNMTIAYTSQSRKTTMRRRIAKNGQYLPKTFGAKIRICQNDLFNYLSSR